MAFSEKAGNVTGRLLALVTIYDGGTRTDAARLGGVGHQTLRALRQVQERAAVQCEGLGWAYRWQAERMSLDAQ